ncbi:hypothetical protein F5Y12DRAFT_767550 [Xylaria sp. FL1777]|nr:hypothetical protein F5Y12DRAFT_767550 [Xylaria sp. FL1777]
MGSIRLGSQNTTAATTCASSGGGSGSGSSSSKPQIILPTKKIKTNPSPNLMKINNGDSKINPTRTVWSTAKERGQAIIRTGRSPAKKRPHITTISTTRTNNNNNSGGSSTTTTTTATITDTNTDTDTYTTQTRTGTTTTTTTTTATTATTTSTAAPQPLLIVSPPHITTSPTNPSTRDTPPSPPLPPPATTTRLHTHTLPCLPPAATRPPLDIRDQNAALVLGRVLKENKKMGHDTYDTSLNLSTTTNARPQMPPLSASAARGINRMPLTPKIASVTRPAQPQTPTVAAANTTVTTPLPRRTQQRPTSTIAAANGSNRAPYDDPANVSAAAFSPHLNSNVTPRSGSRQSRVDSASSTPNGTPSHDRSDAWEAKPAFPFSTSLNQGDVSRRPLVTFNAISPDRSMPLRQDTTNTRDSKFFHASDAKTTRPTSASKMVSPKNPTFFYANGSGMVPKSPSPATLSPPLSPGLNRSQENVSSKFMYANGAPELRSTPPPMLSRGSGTTVPTASKGIVHSAAALQRPASPSKLPLHSPSSYRNSTGSYSAAMSTAATPTAHVQVSPPPSLAPSTPGLPRSGTTTSRSSCHSRSGSLVHGDGAFEPLKPIASPTIGLFPPVNLSPTNPPPLTLASIIQAAEEFTEHENIASPEDQSVLQSPTKSTGSSTDPVTELITNARRERKVQDLQIRNASLEAINRTLERQLRKQIAELRSYRRLSRAGRLSLPSTTTMSSRVPSGSVSELELESLGLESLGLSDLSEEDLSMQNPEDESFSDTDSALSDLSPAVLAARDEKHRERDEERLNLDLSKHQQILVDSQKINQSIKRCLDWTEELINDGKKALEYKVRVSDIRLGGRVLDPLDEEEENSKSILSNGTITLNVKPTEEAPETLTSWGMAPQDRDSGIELPKEGG